MFQIAISNARLAKLLWKLPLYDRICRFDITKIHTISNEALLGYTYRRIGAQGGVTKQTTTGRFSDVDPISAKYIKEYTNCCIHDVGVSNGITSVELYDHLANSGIENFTFTVSDRYAKYHFFKRGLRTDVYNADGKLHCSYMLGVYGDSESSSKYPISRYLFHRASSTLPEQAQTILLYHQRLLKHLDSGEIKHIDYDTFKVFDRFSFDYVRCMNLLNPSYFTHAKLKTGLLNLANDLREGGILQIGRTEQNGNNNVGFYRKAHGRLDEVHRLGSGSDVHSVICKLQSKTLSEHESSGNVDLPRKNQGSHP